MHFVSFCLHEYAFKFYQTYRTVKNYFLALLECHIEYIIQIYIKMYNFLI